MTHSQIVDVLVVGAGLSGMTAAYALSREGLRVTVLEAKDRLGGRTHTKSDAPGGPLDLGGMYIGKTHHRSRDLGMQLGFQPISAPSAGKVVFRSDGNVQQVPQGTYPKTLRGSVDFDLKMTEAYARFDKIATRVGTTGPWDSPFARALDAVTVSSWLKDNIKDRVVRDVLATHINIIVGADPAELSMLFWAHYLAKCENMHALEVTAQYELWRGGAQQLSERIADEPGVEVLLDWPVREIDYDERGVTIGGERGSLRARAAIIAMPPSASAAVVFSPSLPTGRQQLQSRASMGRETKIQIRYARQFWRDRGLSGEIFDLDLEYLGFDATRPGDEYATIVAFIGGRGYDRWSGLTQRARERLLISSLERFSDPSRRISSPFTRQTGPQLVTPWGLLS